MDWWTYRQMDRTSDGQVTQQIYSVLPNSIPNDDKRIKLEQTPYENCILQHTVQTNNQNSHLVMTQLLTVFGWGGSVIKSKWNTPPSTWLALRSITSSSSSKSSHSGGSVGGTEEFIYSIKTGKICAVDSNGLSKISFQAFLISHLVNKMNTENK